MTPAPAVPMVRLGDYVTIKGGGTPRRDIDQYFRGHIPWVTPKDMKVWELYDAELRITDEALRNSTATLVPTNTVLLVVRSGVLKHTVPVAINRVPVAINQDMKSLECHPALSPDYLARLIKAAQPTILSWVRATTADNYSIDTLRELLVPLPPIGEQRRIAAILDQADDLRRKRRLAIEKLNELPQAIFYEMFGSLLLQGKSSRLDSLIEDNDHINYGVVQPGSDSPDGVPLVRASNIVANDFRLESLKLISKKIESQYTRSRLRGFEVLVACVGSIGAVSLATRELAGMNIARAVARIPVDSKKVNRIFLAEFLKLSQTQRYFVAETRTVAQPTLNIKQLAETRILDAPLYVQNQFAERVVQLHLIIDRCENSLRKFDQLFASLQHLAFSGELFAANLESALAV